MFEILLTLCLIAQPDRCRIERLPGGETLSACREAARALDDTWAEEAVQAWPCVPAGTTPGFAVTEVAPGVFVHRGQIAEAAPANRGDLANLGFVIGEEAVAVIDTGSTPEIGARLLAAIRAETDLPVRWAILTHMHPDHALGTQPFAEAGATVIGHHKLPSALANRAEFYRAATADLLGVTIPESAVIVPTETVSDSRSLDLGGRVLELTAHPTAHTDNDLTVLDRQTGTLFLGDLVFLGHIPALDGSLAGWLAVLHRLSAQNAALAVPGHGPAAAPWPEAAEPTQAYLATLAEEVRTAIREGKSLLDASRSIAADAPPGWALHPLFHARNATVAFKELEWE